MWAAPVALIGIARGTCDDCCALAVEYRAEVSNVVCEGAPTSIGKTYTGARLFAVEIFLDADVAGGFQSGDVCTEISFSGVNDRLEADEFDSFAARQRL